MDFTNLAQKYGTPLYIYDFDYMAHRYEALKNAFCSKGFISLLSSVCKHLLNEISNRQR